MTIARFLTFFAQFRYAKETWAGKNAGWIFQNTCPAQFSVLLRDIMRASHRRNLNSGNKVHTGGLTASFRTFYVVLPSTISYLSVGSSVVSALCSISVIYFQIHRSSQQHDFTDNTQISCSHTASYHWRAIERDADPGNEFGSAPVDTFFQCIIRYPADKMDSN